MENKVQNDEMLYRAIKRSKPDWLENGKPTSVMFKDANGNSVDRGDKRSIDDIVQFMKNVTFGKRLKGVVELCAGFCTEVGAEVIAAPTENNPYHANIYMADDEQMSSLQALFLADRSRVVYEDKTIQWVGQ